MQHNKSTIFAKVDFFFVQLLETAEVPEMFFQRHVQKNDRLDSFMSD